MVVVDKVDKVERQTRKQEDRGITMYSRMRSSWTRTVYRAWLDGWILMGREEGERVGFMEGSRFSSRSPDMSWRDKDRGGGEDGEGW